MTDKPRRPRKLTNLVVDEVSSVDAGAGEGVRIMLVKNAPVDLYTSLAPEGLSDDTVVYLKREFSAEQRSSAASSGAALPDGSFPIENAADLHNAMRAIGRAKDEAKAKAHIRSRARALGLTSELSDAFKVIGYSERLGKFFSDLFGRRLTVEEVVDKSSAELAEAIADILSAPEEQRPALMQKAFMKHGDQLIDGITKAMSSGPVDDDSRRDRRDDGGQAMPAEIKKALGLPADASNEAVLKANADRDAEMEIFKAGMTTEEKAFHDALDADVDKTAFRKMTREQRAERMTKGVPDAVRKQIAEMDDLRKQVKSLTTEALLGAFAKQCEETDLPASFAPTLMKAYEGDKSAIDKLLAVCKTSAAAARAAGVFKEFGDQRDGQGNSAYDQLSGKAADLRKTQPNLTKEQAFAKVYEDPANVDLVKRERIESAPRLA